MFKEEYKKDFENIKPSEDFLNNLAAKMHEVEKVEAKKNVTPIRKRKWKVPVAVAAACLVVVVGGSVYLFQGNAEKNNTSNNETIHNHAGVNQPEKSWESVSKQNLFTESMSPSEHFGNLTKLANDTKSVIYKSGKELNDSEKKSLCERLEKGEYTQTKNQAGPMEEFVISSEKYNDISFQICNDTWVVIPDVNGCFRLK